MNSVKEHSIIANFYEKLENVDECVSLITPNITDWDSISDELRLKICIECNSFTNLSPEIIKGKFETDKKTVIEYLKERINNTQNILLRARYNHFSYCLTKNNLYANHAIEEYQKVLSQLNEKDDINFLIHRFPELLSIIISLTENTKYKTEELKTQIHNYLKDIDFHNRLKTSVISLILDTKLFKASELCYVINLCIVLSEKEKDHRLIEVNLKLGLDIAIKTNDIGCRRKINELLGDNEYLNIKQYDGKAENILIPHLNGNILLKIIQYYKNAKNTEKKDSAILKYNENKRKYKLLKIKNTVHDDNFEEKHEKLNEFFISKTNSSTKIIVNNLIFGGSFLALPNSYLVKYTESEKDNIVYKLLSPKHIDLNNNEQSIEIKEYLQFMFYSNSLPRAIDFVFDIIMISIANGKLSYSKLAKILNSDIYLGQELNINRNGQEIPYTWFSIIDIGIRSFFEQCKIIQTNKQPDWRFVIDFLSLKFEGILRDIVRLTSGIITKIDKGNTTGMLLDDLLRDETINKLFATDDMNLFKYTFTSKGYNIRNNVAHSFYKPYDYTKFNAVLVFLSVLRLAKFELISFNEKGNNKTTMA